MHFGLHLGELFLKLGARQDLKTHIVRGEENKITMAAREAVIHDQLFALIGVRVNEPRSGGAGNSNRYIT